MESTWIDRSIGFFAPTWALQRQRARMARTLLSRHYEAATTGRRTQGWKRSSGDANAALQGALGRLRDHARDLVRNNPYARSARDTIADHVVGWGIVPSEEHPQFKAWAESTAVDAAGHHDLAGLQKLIMRTVVESGEALVRRRWRRMRDGLPLPMQLEVLEPDYLDTLKDHSLPNDGRIVQGVEFDASGRRVAYWLYREHPGSVFRGRMGSFASQRVPADDVLHVFRVDRPEQVRGPSWFAPVVLKLKDYDEYEDAQLMKQKIAACLAVLTSDVDGNAPPIGTVDANDPAVDSLEPGMVLNLPPGRNVHVVNPPRMGGGEFRDFSELTLRAIATGIGVSYEDLTGDYTELPFSAARMSRLRHWARIEDWRWLLLEPQFLTPVWRWAMEAAAIMGLRVIPETEWTAPPLPMIEPDKEGLAIQRNVRSGITTLSEAIRERGFNPRRHLAALAADFRQLDELGLVLDSDPRKMTQAGQWQERPTSDGEPDSDEPAEPNDDDEDGGEAPAAEEKPEDDERALLTPRQREVLDAVAAYEQFHRAPAPASHVAEQLGLSHERVRTLYRTLHRAGWLRAPATPAALARAWAGR